LYLKNIKKIKFFFFLKKKKLKRFFFFFFFNFLGIDPHFAIFVNKKNKLTLTKPIFFNNILKYNDNSNRSNENENENENENDNN